MQNNGQQGGKKNIIYLFAFQSTLGSFIQEGKTAALRSVATYLLDSKLFSTC